MSFDLSKITGDEPPMEVECETCQAAKEALEKALAVIYSWAIDGHAYWCLNPDVGNCTCGHDQAVEMLTSETSEPPNGV